jgi:hypothetical protein
MLLGHTVKDMEALKPSLETSRKGDKLMVKGIFEIDERDPSVLSLKFPSSSSSSVLSELKTLFSELGSFHISPMEPGSPGEAMIPLLDLAIDRILSAAQGIRSGIKLYPKLNPEVMETPDAQRDVTLTSQRVPIWRGTVGEDGVIKYEMIGSHWDPRAALATASEPTLSSDPGSSNFDLMQTRQVPNRAITDETTAEVLDFIVELLVVIKNCRGKVPKSISSALLDPRLHEFLINEFRRSSKRLRSRNRHHRSRKSSNNLNRQGRSI